MKRSCIIIFSVCIALFVAYACGYLFLSRTVMGRAHLQQTMWRYFPDYWPLQVWRPLGYLESKWYNGMPIVLSSEDETVEIWCQ